MGYTEYICRKNMKHSYKPLEDYLDVLESNIHGKGLFVTKDVSKGKITNVSHVLMKYEEESVLYRTPTGGFINHSEDPDVIMVKIDSNYPSTRLFGFKFIRDVKAGSEITIDYRSTPCVIKDSDNENLFFE